MVDRRSIAIFEDRYGVGSHAELVALLRRPCVTFAHIAERFGVTRERVRQWHRQLLPDAPRGHDRQRLCRQQRQRRLLLSDTLFAGFYHHIRAELPEQKVTLISSSTGYRKRLLRLDDAVVVLKKARLTPPVLAPHEARVYWLTNGVNHADFVYYELTAADFLFVPRSAVPHRATTFRDTGGSTYQGYKNTFAAYAKMRR